MKAMFDFMAEVKALQDELAQLRAASLQAEAAGDCAILDELIAQATRNREKVEALLARAQEASASLNRKSRRLQKASLRKAH